MTFEQVGRDIYQQVNNIDDTPNQLTTQEEQEITQKYEKESANIRKITELWLAAFKDALSLSSEEIKHIQKKLWEVDDGVFWPKSFNAYLYHIEAQGTIMTLWDILWNKAEIAEHKTVQESVQGENTEVQIEREIVSYPIRDTTHARQLQTFLQQEWYYTLWIDWDFWKGSKQALQTYLKNMWYYTGPIDAIIWNGTLRALNELQSWARPSPMTQEEIVRANENLRSAEWLQNFEQLPESWKVIYQEFFQKLRPNEQQEVLSGKPFTLVDSRTKQLIFVEDNKVVQMDVILGQNGTTNGNYVPYDKRTPVGMIHRFNRVVLSEDKGRNILRAWEPYHPDLMPADNAQWRNLYFDESVQTYRWEKYSNSKGRWERNKRVTVVGVSIQSDVAAQYGGRYFHLVWPGRNGTWGCVWIKYEDRAQARAMANTMAAEGWFWYVSRA